MKRQKKAEEEKIRLTIYDSWILLLKIFMHKYWIES